MLLIQIIRFIPVRAADTDHMSAECMALSRVIPADISESEHEDRRTFHRCNISHGLPYVLCLVRMVLVKAADQVKSQRQHMFRYGKPVSARCICEHRLFRKDPRFDVLVCTGRV